METCIFCRIIEGKVPANKVYEDEHTLAFNDINPQAPVHILVIPREHYAGVHEIPEDRGDIISQLFSTVTKVVTQEGLLEAGYRLVINFGRSSGQEVPHIHIHILAGRSMQWPPG